VKIHVTRWGSWHREPLGLSDWECAACGNEWRNADLDELAPDACPACGCYELQTADPTIRVVPCDCIERALAVLAGATGQPRQEASA